MNEWVRLKNYFMIKENKNKLFFTVFEVGIIFTILGAYVNYAFYPMIQSVERYEKEPNYDPVLALSGIFGSVLPLLLIIELPIHYVTLPIAQKLGWITLHNKENVS